MLRALLRPLTAVVLATFCTTASTTAIAAEVDAVGIEFFEKKIRPVLAARCYECHSREAKTLQGGLLLDSRSGILAGGDSGPSLVPGRPAESLLLHSIGFESDVSEMPPSGKLPDAEIAALAEWVRRGAPLPDDGPDAPAIKKSIDFEAGRRFWSFQPLQKSEPPEVKQADWARRPIDAFLLAELERHNLAPSPAADRRTLIRRATFGLIGLPPSPEEVEAFVSDPSADDEAFTALVERLLNSPHYGEHWGRFWLDLARYCDKDGSSDNNNRATDVVGQPWLYRDWVVRALNNDLPYDEFVRRQLATDLMPETGPDDIPALGFLGLSPVYWKELLLDKDVISAIVAEEREERIDAIGRTFLGLTIACARCHDHKYDPISAEDYYGLAGVLANTRVVDQLPLAEAEAQVVRQAQTRVKGLRGKIDQLKKEKPAPDDLEQQVARLTTRIEEIEQTTPHYHTPWVRAVDDAALYVLSTSDNRTKLDYRPGEAIDLHLEIRGNPSNPGPLVPRRFLTVLSSDSPRRLNRGSGRLDLAEAIVVDAAHLSSRVIVNRIWKQHFGRGLVETTSDFGTQGSPPSHPALLDYLAARLIEQGWSLKWLHRELLLSAAYRQASDYDAAKQAVDPENRLLWRMNRRRLEIESWRDAMLAVAGTLRCELEGPPIALTNADNHRRTLYAYIDRRDVDTMLRLHDFPDPTTHSPGRLPTNTPLQQLFVLNSPFIAAQAQALAARLAREEDAPLARVHRAYRLLFGRGPTAAESELAVAFLRGNTTLDADWQRYAHVLLGSNEFLFID